MSLEVIPIGAEVEIKDTDIKGLVTQITIRPGPGISYELSWMNEGEAQSGIFYDFELNMRDATTEKIGFKGKANA